MVDTDAGQRPRPGPALFCGQPVVRDGLLGAWLWRFRSIPACLSDTDKHGTHHLGINPRRMGSDAPARLGLGTTRHVRKTTGALTLSEQI